MTTCRIGSLEDVAMQYSLPHRQLKMPEDTPFSGILFPLKHNQTQLITINILFTFIMGKAQFPITQRNNSLT